MVAFFSAPLARVFGGLGTPWVKSTATTIHPAILERPTAAVRSNERAQADRMKSLARIQSNLQGKVRPRFA